MESVAVLILAAGMGKRMGSKTPKVAIRTSEKPLIEHLLETVSALDPEKVVVVTGHGREVVEGVVQDALHRHRLPRVEFAYQERQLGTGHAVQCALPFLDSFVGTVLILVGDAPLLKPSTLRQMLQIHAADKATITLASFLVDTPAGYGRVIRDRSSRFAEKIVESKDCTPEQALIREVNSGIYAIDSSFLAPAVKELGKENSQGEYYLTDIVETASREGQTVSVMVVPDPSELQGVNTLSDLAEVNKTILNRKIHALIDSGVILEDPNSVFIQGNPEVSPGTRIGPNTQLRGNTLISSGVVIEGSACLIDTVVSERAYIKFGVRAEGASIGPECTVGPFAHLRPGTILHSGVKIGNFVETKKTTVGRRSSASHLTYLGDCTVGEGVNIGAGTITCNYDGSLKHETRIEDGAFIGSNTALVAPVTIGAGATIGAGSVITKDVESGALALTRAPQTARAGYRQKSRNT
jgi:bifunctional UDP-N-acetylglucosamine pyrophosphorylase / glucosamine-1-phosphate N-acetyltransferase